eukprot:SAG22_NODE_28_length_28728_cov_19.603619_17_plen_92_part_00
MASLPLHRVASKSRGDSRRSVPRRPGERVKLRIANSIPVSRRPLRRELAKLAARPGDKFSLDSLVLPALAMLALVLLLLVAASATSVGATH